jgi:YcxB-like protein
MGVALPPAPQVNVWLLLVPTLVPAMFLTLFLLYGTILSIRRQTDSPDAVAKRKRKGITTIAIWLILAISALPLVLLDEHFRIDVDADHFPIGSVTIFIWIGAILLLLFLIRLTQKHGARNIWNANPSLHRPKVCEIDERGVRTIDDRTDLFYGWSNFERYRETSNLFCLSTQDRILLFIPKRAFAIDADIDAFCALVQNNIKTGDFLPREARFSVVPLAMTSAVGAARNSTGG